MLLHYFLTSGKTTSAGFNFPASELALIVQSCQSVGITPSAEIVLLAGKAPAPAPVVAPVVAPVPVMATTAAAVPIVASTSSATAARPRAEKQANSRDSPKDREARGSSTAASSKSDRDGTRRDREKSHKRSSDGQKSEVDTVSAIQQLERSCLQKPSTGSGPAAKVTATALSSRSAPAPRAAGASAAPVHSVWKIPSSASAGGIQESKTDVVEGVKSLKEIQVSSEL
jgi:hypothetical protein